MHGVINVLKHAGVTSHDIVSSIRKICRTKKVGHTGTLDPDAVGVLPICVGKATRLVEYLTSTTKTYRAELSFGHETDTQDSSGQITKTTPLPLVKETEFNNILKQFIGEIKQVPPMFSAIKKDGQPLYKLARQGEVVQVEPRIVKIYSISLLELQKDRALIEVVCGKGTYIRTLCQDIGRALNSSAYMSFLLRTQSGNFHINNALTVEEISLLAPEEFLLNPADALIDWPQLIIEDTHIEKLILNGNQIPLDLIEKKVTPVTNCKVLNAQGDLLAIGEINNDFFKPKKVFR